MLVIRMYRHPHFQAEISMRRDGLAAVVEQGGEQDDVGAGTS
jgi:hypothetical protein